MHICPPVTVSCTSLSRSLLQKAELLAKKLRLPFSPPERCTSRYILNFTDTHLELGINNTLADAPVFSPIFIDFLQGSTAYRHARNLTIKQPLARAVGIKSGFRPDVFDGTAGLGGDGFVLACLGCQVILNERSPVIAALLADGLERGLADRKIGEIISQRIKLFTGETEETLASLDHSPYTIYLDPMYPHAEKSALNKKEMRMIRDIVGNDNDGDQLLLAALQHAANRVVVKRPKGAEYLAGRSPSHEILMKNSRFDIYLTSHL